MGYGGLPNFTEYDAAPARVLLDATLGHNVQDFRTYLVAVERPADAAAPAVAAQPARAERDRRGELERRHRREHPGRSSRAPRRALSRRSRPRPRAGFETTISVPHQRALRGRRRRSRSAGADARAPRPRSGPSSSRARSAPAPHGQVLPDAAYDALDRVQAVHGRQRPLGGAASRVSSASRPRCLRARTSVNGSGARSSSRVASLERGAQCPSWRLSPGACCRARRRPPGVRVVVELGPGSPRASGSSVRPAPVGVGRVLGLARDAGHSRAGARWPRRARSANSVTHLVGGVQRVGRARARRGRRGSRARSARVGEVRVARVARASAFEPVAIVSSSGARSTLEVSCVRARCSARAPSLPRRVLDDQRHADRLLVDARALAAQAVRGAVLAVVGGEHDDRVRGHLGAALRACAARAPTWRSTSRCSFT